MAKTKKKHLAILNQPFLDLILEGKKTIESRFTKVRCAPYGAVEEGDIILLKESGGPVLGEFTAGRVETFDGLDMEVLATLAARYERRICSEADPDFWQKRCDVRYATLIYVTKPIRYDKSFLYPKRDRRGWIAGV